MVVINEFGEVEIVLAAPAERDAEATAEVSEATAGAAEATSTADEATPVPTYEQGIAFEVGKDSQANTDKAGGVIMIIIIVVCAGFVLEGLISFFVKAKKRHDDKFM